MINVFQLAKCILNGTPAKYLIEGLCQTNIKEISFQEMWAKSSNCRVVAPNKLFSIQTLQGLGKKECVQITVF